MFAVSGTPERWRWGGWRGCNHGARETWCVPVQQHRCAPLQTDSPSLAATFTAAPTAPPPGRPSARCPRTRAGRLNFKSSAGGPGEQSTRVGERQPLECEVVLVPKDFQLHRSAALGEWGMGGGGWWGREKNISQLLDGGNVKRHRGDAALPADS